MRTLLPMIGLVGLSSCVGSDDSALSDTQQARQPPTHPQGKIDITSKTPGGPPSTAGASCQALLEFGVTLSGVYWVINPNPADPSQIRLPMRTYCDQEVNGGGWALVYNSVLGAATLDFWNIPYAQRLGRRGRPSLDSNYYDGSLYQTAPVTYMDVIEDLQDKVGIAFVARAASIDNVSMRFNNPVLVSGNSSLFNEQFAGGWSAPDYDGDEDSSLNCATNNNNVTQHYGSCWYYNLGSDADMSGGDTTDQRLGPHVYNVVLASLSLAGDGSSYSRVRAIRRYVKW